MDLLNHKKLDFISNLGMAVFGLTSFVLISFKIRWGFVFGLCSQPFFYLFNFKSPMGIFYS